MIVNDSNAVRVLRTGQILMVCFVVCLTGCAIGNNRPNVNIAYGHMVFDPSLEMENIISSELIIKKYQLDEIQRGYFYTNDYIYVSFERESIHPTGLPLNAILIMQLCSCTFETLGEAKAYMHSSNTGHPFDVRCYEPIRGDASLGILSDTPENRKKISSLSLEQFLKNPRSKRLSKKEALALARLELVKEEELEKGMKYKFKTSRYGFGWYITCDLIQQNDMVSTGRDLLKISDEGKIIQRIKGR